MTECVDVLADGLVQVRFVAIAWLGSTPQQASELKDTAPTFTATFNLYKLKAWLDCYSGRFCVSISLLKALAGKSSRASRECHTNDEVSIPRHGNSSRKTSIHTDTQGSPLCHQLPMSPSRCFRCCTRVLLATMYCRDERKLSGHEGRTEPQCNL